MAHDHGTVQVAIHYHCDSDQSSLEFMSFDGDIEGGNDFLASARAMEASGDLFAICEELTESLRSHAISAPPTTCNRGHDFDLVERADTLIRSIRQRFSFPSSIFIMAHARNTSSAPNKQSSSFEDWYRSLDELCGEMFLNSWESLGFGKQDARRYYQDGNTIEEVCEFLIYKYDLDDCRDPKVWDRYIVNLHHPRSGLFHRHFRDSF